MSPSFFFFRVEYHDILWDIGFAETYEDAFQRIENLYVERPPLEDFLLWRDLRVIDEISWYGWFIDYYMESGLMRVRSDVDIDFNLLRNFFVGCFTQEFITPLFILSFTGYVYEKYDYAATLVQAHGADWVLQRSACL